MRPEAMEGGAMDRDRELMAYVEKVNQAMKPTE